MEEETNESKVAIAVVLALMVGLVATFSTSQPVAAIGPVDIPAGGVTKGDDDTGNGEKWGRVGGRTLTFSNFDFSQVTELTWGLSGAVTMAFDGGVDEVGETLTYVGNTPGTGIATWVGSTEVVLAIPPLEMAVLLEHKRLIQRSYLQ